MNKNKKRIKSLLDKENKPHKNLKSLHKKSSNKSFSQQRTTIGPFITATFTAIIIGIFLGVIMLNMFATKDDIASKNDDQLVTGHKGNNSNDNNDIEREESKPTKLNHMSAFVLQLGVFSEPENAEAWSSTYQQAGFPSVYFNRDNQYFLFAGLAATKEKADEFAAKLLAEDVEVYVKEWITNEIEVELTEAENNWLTLFQEQWEATLISLSKQEGLLLEGWSDLIGDYPTRSETIKSLVQVVQLLPQNEQEISNSFEAQNYLLNIWKTYEELFADN